MRLDSLSGLSRSDSVTSSRDVTGTKLNVSEGDVVRARVISVLDGEASLKTTTGAILHARLEGGVTLTPGTDVYLTVTDGSGENLVMTLTAAPANTSARDPAFQAITATLTQLGYQPDAATVAKMTELLQVFPDMPPEEAAFFAAQKISPDSGLREAFRAMNSGESAAGAMLDNLMTAASESAKSEVQLPQNTAADLFPNAAIDAQKPASPEVSVTIAAAETSQPTEPAIIRNAAAEAAPQSADTTQAANAPPQSQTLSSSIPDFGKWLFEALGASSGEKPVFTGKALSGTPLLEGLSARTLEGMADSMTRIARSMPEFENERELFQSIAKFAEELFLKPREDSDKQLAYKLRSVREELYVKLAYFSEAVKMSGAQSKAAVLEQTQKLMEHVRMLSGLDKFVCVQLPIQLGEQKQSAELYICTRERGGKKRIDPEDVRLLLALDLEHMGRLEAQVEIKGRDISLNFEVDNEDVATRFRQNTTKLHKMLDGLGYKFTNSSVKIKKSDTKLENALLTLLEPERGGFEVLV